MPYAPDDALLDSGFQPLSRVHSLSKQGIWSSPKPACSSSVQPIARLPVNSLQEPGTGYWVFVLVPERLASCCARAAVSLACLALAAASRAAAPARALASAGAFSLAAPRAGVPVGAGATESSVRR